MIETRGLTRRFGALVALDDLTLSIGEGEVFGFIGPNGAGKSTTMKILTCLLAPSSGHATVGGHDVRIDGDRIRRMVGYMPDFLGVYDDLTVDEYLQFFAAAFGVHRKRRPAVVGEVLELTDLTGKRDAMVDSLSRGMQQRLGIARVLIHEPKVLLLDEPASGLDPRARIEIRSLLTELSRMGKTIMISSHILSELAEMCSSIGIIERGKLLFAGTIQEAYAKTRAGERVLVCLDPAGSATAQRAGAVLERLDTVQTVEIDGQTLTVDLTPGVSDHHAPLEALIACGARVQTFTPVQIKLEDAFLRLTKGALQ